MLQATTLGFLSALKNNNSKEWFDKNKSTYQTAKADVETFLEKLLSDLQKIDNELAGVNVKKAMFRINRDVRFSKNKSPYKTNFGAVLSPGGKKSSIPGLYIHIDPSEAFLAGGIWMPEPTTLHAIRQEIEYNLPEFNKIIGNKTFKSHFKTLNQDDKLVNMPKGFPKDSPAGEFLKLKSFIVIEKLSTAEMVSKSFQKKAVEVYKAMYPFNQFLRRALD